MAKCWTCGTSVTGYEYRCSYCKDVVREIDSLHESISGGFAALAEIQRWGFNQLSDRLSEISTILEWGFGELSWQLKQQTDILRNIDHTLKTPSETKANEWRLHAEELRRRGVLEESEEFFLKALNEYRLDYRIYVGLAETYLQMSTFDKARVYLEKSLPHAPKKEIDYKSYSYRLIGHIYACEEDYCHAMDILQTAIELSPTYEDGHYDYAQYSAQMKNAEACLSSLQKAILAKPVYWYLAKSEQNFTLVRSEVEKLLSYINAEASRTAKDSIAKSESELKEANKQFSMVLEEADKIISGAKQALDESGGKATLCSNTMFESAKSRYQLSYKDAKSALEEAIEKVRAGDYVAFLEAKPIAEKSRNLTISAKDTFLKEYKNAINEANKEREHYRRIRAEKVENAWKKVPFAFIGRPLIFGFVGWFLFGLGGCWFVRYPHQDLLWEPIRTAYLNEGIVGLLIGVIGSVIFGIWEFKKELE